MDDTHARSSGRRGGVVKLLQDGPRQAIQRSSILGGSASRLVQTIHQHGLGAIGLQTPIGIQ